MGVFFRVGLCLLVAACSSTRSPPDAVPAFDSSAGASGTTSGSGGRGGSIGGGSGGDDAGGGGSAGTNPGGTGGYPSMDAASEPDRWDPVSAFGSFNFEFEGRPVSEQVDLLVGNGYRHLSFWWEPQGSVPLADFLADERVAKRTLPVLAVLFAIDASQAHDISRTSATVQALAGRDTALWLLLLGQVDDSVLVRVVREVADIARDSGVRVVLYPHQGDMMADAEDALRIQRAAERPNVGISLHLCHEFKAGNRDRLSEVIQNVVAEVDIASINGTDSAIDTQSTDWSHTIMPLDRGDFDVENNYLVPLWKAGYRGPLVLHTYGIESPPPEEHLRRSADRFRNMAERLR